MALITFPSNIATQSATLDVAEFTVTSASRTGKIASEYFSQGGAAGAGFAFGEIVFPRGAVDSLQGAAQKTRVDEWLKFMGGDRPSFVWCKVPFDVFNKPTPRIESPPNSGTMIIDPATHTVTSQADMDGDLVTTMSAAWTTLEVGMWVSVRSSPRKACYVLEKRSETQFVFIPQHKMPANILISACNEIWLRKAQYNPQRDPKVLQSATEISPAQRFDWVELSQVGRA